MNRIIIQTAKLLMCIIICALAGIIGSFATVSAIPDWYENLQKPGFTPPAWLFGPVWTVLYILMGVSLYLIWQRDSGHRLFMIAVAVFAVQLILNAVWSLLFFGLRSPLLGLVDIIPLWAAILASAAIFFRIYTLAGLLLLPYLLWVTFAVVLNFKIWQMN